MYDLEALNLMKPKISVEYYLTAGLLNYGSLEEVPQNAWGAHICQSSPIISAAGEFIANSNSYNIFVGLCLPIKEILEKSSDEKLKKESEKLKNLGYDTAVITSSSKKTLYPVGYLDAVVSTNQELALAISKINATFKSVKYDVRNSGQEIDKAASRGL